MASVGPAFVLLRGIQLWRALTGLELLHNEADFELTETCLPLSAAIQTRNTMPERPLCFLFLQAICKLTFCTGHAMIRPASRRRLSLSSASP